MKKSKNKMKRIREQERRAKYTRKIFSVLPTPTPQKFWQSLSITDKLLISELTARGMGEDNMRNLILRAFPNPSADQMKEIYLAIKNHPMIDIWRI